MEQSGAKAYLVNTGWNGTGKRISIKDTRAIIAAILDGSIEEQETKHVPHFNLKVPLELPNVETAILDPRNTYSTSDVWTQKAKDLATLFIDNFDKYTDTPEGKALLVATPTLS